LKVARAFCESLSKLLFGGLLLHLLYEGNWSGCLPSPCKPGVAKIMSWIVDPTTFLVLFAAAAWARIISTNFFRFNQIPLDLFVERLS
jgi:uncharacterized membrane protein YjjP (DUF1212 family)